MTTASWSQCAGAECIRLGALPDATDVQVRTATAPPGFPSMVGRLVRDGADLCFVPRFPFIAGVPYLAVINGAVTGVLLRPRPNRPATTEVLSICPTATEVPRNLLRLYVEFSAPMSEGYAASHIRVLTDRGEDLIGALLPTEHELWDGAHRRLTVLLDPARIKRGLVPHSQAGYALEFGKSCRVVVDTGFLDADGVELHATAERRYDIGPDERRHVDPADWTLTLPPNNTREPLDIRFDRPLDHGLLARCLQVVGPDNRRVDGAAAIRAEARSWRFIPDAAWAPGRHELLVDPILEDLAGNSVSRIFDRDLTRASDEPRPAEPVTVIIRPR